MHETRLFVLYDFGYQILYKDIQVRGLHIKAKKKIHILTFNLIDKQQCSCKSNVKEFPSEIQDRNHMQTIKTTTIDPFNGFHVVSNEMFILTTAVWFHMSVCSLTLWHNFSCICSDMIWKHSYLI